MSCIITVMASALRVAGTGGVLGRVMAIGDVDHRFVASSSKILRFASMFARIANPRPVILNPCPGTPKCSAYGVDEREVADADHFIYDFSNSKIFVPLAGFKTRISGNRRCWKACFDEFVRVSVDLFMILIELKSIKRSNDISSHWSCSLG